MASDSWIDDALKTTRLSHRALTSFAVAASFYFTAQLALLPPRWDVAFDKLEQHWESAWSTIEYAALVEATIHGVEPEQLCVRVGDRADTLEAWTVRYQHKPPSVSEIVEFAEAAVLVPPTGSGAASVEFDCDAGLLRRADESTVKLVPMPLYFNTSDLAVVSS